MDQDRIARAMARIEAAAERVEAAVAARARLSDTETARLREQYDALRAETGAALADLDQLIGKLASPIAENQAETSVPELSAAELSVQK